MRYPDLDIDLLRAFVAVADAGGFTAASEVVRRSQSAVSQKILRLEDLLGRRLFERTSRTLSLTPEGEQLLPMARRILELNEVAVRTLVDPPVSGTLRLGISDDFIPKQLPALLARFRRLNPAVHLELMNGMSAPLFAAYEAGRLDAVIAKHDGAGQRGRVIWREPLVWMSAVDREPHPDQPVPLVLLPGPCTYRDLMIQAMDAVGRKWFPACTASSLIGVQAAVAAGLGITILGRSFVQEGLVIFPPSQDWPPLPMTEIVVIGEDTSAGTPLRPLIAFLIESLIGAIAPATAAEPGLASSA